MVVKINQYTNINKIGFMKTFAMFFTFFFVNKDFFVTYDETMLPTGLIIENLN